MILSSDERFIANPYQVFDEADLAWLMEFKNMGTADRLRDKVTVSFDGISLNQTLNVGESILDLSGAAQALDTVTVTQ